MSNRKRKKDITVDINKTKIGSKSEEAIDTSEQEEHQDKPRAHPKSRWPIIAISALGPLLAVLFGLYLYFNGGRYVVTDNAFVKSDKIAVSADISGRVTDVLVKANDVVTPGALLFRIDAEPFLIAVEQAKAQLQATIQEAEAQKSLYRQRLASIEQAKTDVGFYKLRLERRNKLQRRALTSLDNVETAEQSMRNAQSRMLVLKQELAQVLAQLGGDADTPTNRLPRVLAASAALKRAELNHKHTQVRAPVAGVVTNFDLQKGEYVEAGRTMFSIVGTDDIWIQANFRETDLTHMRTGQAARIRVDAYPQDDREAIIHSIDPATGAEFALLPPQNATGNWVKVVQRLPVRLEIKGTRRDQPLRSGMSVVVEVDTKHERTFDDLVKTLTSWFQG